MPDPLVYVYGHYDSRGGATAVIASNRTSADHVYDEELFWHSDMIRDFEKNSSKFLWNPINEPDNRPSQEDFLYEVILQNAPDIDTELMVEYCEDKDDPNAGEIWIKEGAGYVTEMVWLPAKQVEGPIKKPLGWSDPLDPNPALMVIDQCQRPASLHLVTMPNGGQLFFDTDRSERIDGWREAGLGEDAFGLILMSRLNVNVRDYSHCR